MSGTNSLTETLAIATLALPPTPAGARALVSTPLSDIICKLARVSYTNAEGAYVVISNSNLIRIHDVQLEKVDDPPDFFDQTQWQQKFPCEAIARSLRLTIDTGGVNATINLQADGSTLQALTVNTSDSDRRRLISLNSNLIGKLWRLTGANGGGGKTKLWDFDLEALPEPCPTTLFDTYELSFGYQGWKNLKLVELMYICAASPLVSFYVITAAAPMKIYADASRLEFIAHGASRHQALQQKTFSELIGPVVA